MIVYFKENAASLNLRHVYPLLFQQMPQPQVAKGDAVYAQVNKDRKSQHGQYADDYDQSPAPPSMSVADAPAGDSWV